MLPNPEHAQEEEEPEPLDPKAASRAIRRHIDRKRATEIRRKEDPVRTGLPVSGEEDALKGVTIRNRDLVQMMEHSPGSLMDDWMQVQLGDDPKLALQVSRTEMEFLLFKRTLLE